MSRIEDVGSFTTADNDGNEYVVRIFREMVEVNDRSGRSERPGKRWMKTEDGRHVNHEGKGQYEIVDVLGNIPITSTDPIAP